jgi:hypothetical protein
MDLLGDGLGRARAGCEVKASRVIKIVAIACLIFFVVALVITRDSPATSYEASIYTATPLIFWAASLLSVICGISIVVQQVYTGEHTRSNLWVIGFLLIVIPYASILSLWLIRGYALWCLGDPLSHLGTAQNIIASGYVDQYNYYPITHVYLAEVSSVLGIPAAEPFKYITLVFGLLYLLFMYVLAKSLLSSKGALILAAVVSTMFLSGTNISFSPNMLANLFLPFALFLLVKKSAQGTISWRALFILMAFMFPLFHPVPSLVLLLVLITAWVPVAMLGKEAPASIPNVFRFSLPVSLFLFVWAITWFLSFGVWDATIRDLQVLITERGFSHLMLLGQQIQYAQEYNYSIAVQFLSVYGGTFLCMVLSLVAFPLLYKKAISGREQRNLLSLYGPLIALVLAIVVLYLLNMTFSPLRLLPYIVIICTMFVGFTLYKILEWRGSSRHVVRPELHVTFGPDILRDTEGYLEKGQSSRHVIRPELHVTFEPDILRDTKGYLEKGQSSRHINYRHRVVPLLVILVLVAMSVGGTLSLYPSRYVLLPNYQVTRTEIEGMNWFFHSKDTTKPITGISIQPRRFADFLLTPEERKEQRFLDLEILREGEGVMPWHFGYDKYSGLGEWYDLVAYLVINQQDRVVYEEVYPEMKEIRFTPEDFRRLKQDSSVDMLYTNGGLNIYYVTPTPQP